MSEVQFTNGPWLYDPNDRDDLQIRDSKRRLIADVNDNRDMPLQECKANAKLIAAAPDLLSCLIDCIENVLLDFPDSDPRKLRYNGAIAKATV